MKKKFDTPRQRSARKNRDKLAAACRRWRKRHPEKRKAATYRWRKRNRNEWNAYQRRWRKRNPKHVRAATRRRWRKLKKDPARYAKHTWLPNESGLLIIPKPGAEKPQNTGRITAKKYEPTLGAG